MDPDFLKAIIANPQKFHDAVEAGSSTGKKATILVEGTDQFSGKSYLTGEQLPNDLSEGLLEQEKNYRRSLKNSKKGKTIVTRLSLDMLKPEIRSKMQNGEEFCAKRCYVIVIYSSMIYNGIFLFI